MSETGGLKDIGSKTSEISHFSRFDHFFRVWTDRDKIRSMLKSIQNWRPIASVNPVYGVHGNCHVWLLWHFDPKSDATQKFVSLIIIAEVRTLNFTLHRLLDVIVFFCEQ